MNKPISYAAEIADGFILEKSKVILIKGEKMKNEAIVKAALIKAVALALEEHLQETGTLKNLDWFNVSSSTTDFYASLSEELVA